MEEELTVTMENITFNQDGHIVKRHGWKSFRGMIKELRRLNKSLTKMGIVADYTIRLPLKP